MTPKTPFQFPNTGSFDEDVRLLAEHYQEIIKPGQVFHFDFSQTPEYEKPFIEYLSQNFGWVLETPHDIRKPKI